MYPNPLRSYHTDYFNKSNFFSVHCLDCNTNFTHIIDQVEIEIGSSSSSLEEGLMTYLLPEPLDAFDCTL